MMTMGVEWRMASRQYSRAMLNKLSQRLFKDKSVRVKNETKVIECDVAE